MITSTAVFRSHRQTVRTRTTTLYSTECACGWIGPEGEDEAEAIKAYESHLFRRHPSLPDA